MQLQAIFVNNRKWILDVFVGMSRSMNDARMLKLSSIWGDLFNDWTSHEGIKPYIIKDKGYPLHLWFMVHHK
jgi:hypothetical protein